MSCLLKDQNVAILTCSVVTDTVASVIVVAIAIASHVAFVVSTVAVGLKAAAFVLFVRLAPPVVVVILICTVAASIVVATIAVVARIVGAALVAVVVGLAAAVAAVV